ncbi:putative FAD(NAD)-dependent oxidoreductase [Pediococcus damnosus]|uniref:FAD(NAD)-dependent oxidoreductase n=2 Tax=Pediococcus damnosus TaxID=51663 RepID=A0ABN4N9T4_9LACO|nr:FAD/NAD(P)-binding domain-containing protein [Pediococcus damnosus]AMV60256.1 putative FAD(NAD)-dependent oxidoreductase [Pediococcus damnosus]AMV67333.1 putative FAD(NAD)-dependent oxidoreductase [Pediococcus damnosus]AMV69636.1 putative FAD(NAD)-dependent oxidoreductase [Pediococcus damnosus]KJU73526.1 oxidoreductase [Pediococcus damnosus LMG 28219]KRN47456.1 FAD(NAD)-dependent oxidoreductase [Pediococcus damnosus]
MKLALIGAGPRNLMALERLLAWNQRMSVNNLEIHLFDPAGIAGRVWQPAQPHELLMNSLAAKITLFTDHTIEMEGPTIPGPTLLEWAQRSGRAFIADHNYKNKEAFLSEISHLSTNSYASRGLYGVYQEWYYQQLLVDLPENVTVSFHKERVTGIQRLNDHTYKLNFDDAAETFDGVSMALGEGLAEATDSEKELADFASRNNLIYLRSGYAAEQDFDKIPAASAVLLRGLGLNFMDVMIMLTTHRGGTFQRLDDDTLRYKPSGKEPKIYAGSGRGFPYHARGFDQKAIGETRPLYFLSNQLVDHMIENQEQMSGQKFLDLIHSEVACTYYTKLVAQAYTGISAHEFERAFQKDPLSSQVLDDYGIAQEDRLDIEKLEHPEGDAQTAQDLQKVMIQYLEKDIAEAKRGNKISPFSSAMETLRELRTNIRKVITYKLISDDDYARYILGGFNSLNSFLAVGPPILRLEQLLALIKAGVVKILGPKLTVEMKHHHFIAYSKQFLDYKVETDGIVEARLASTDIRMSTNPLIQDLLKSGMARPYQLHFKDDSTKQLGAMDVTTETAEMIDSDGIPVPNVYIWGISTEGRHWLTNGSPIPSVNDVRLRMADTIANQMLNYSE